MWTYHHFTHHLCIHNSPCFYLLSGVCEGTWQLCSLCPQLDRSHLFHHSNRWHKTFDKHCCMYLLIDNLDQKIFSSLLFLNTSKNSYTIKRKTRSTTIRVTSMRSVFIGPIYCEIHKKTKQKKTRNAVKILHYVESYLIIPWKCAGVCHVILWGVGATSSFQEDRLPQHKILRKKFFPCLLYLGLSF